MLPVQPPKRLISPIISFSGTTANECKKKRYKSLWTLNAFSLESSLFNSLHSCVRNTKYIRALNTNFPSKKHIDAVTPCLKGLKRIYIRKDQDTRLGFKAMHRAHRRLSTLKSYHCALSVKLMPVFKSLRSVENFEFRITDKALAKVNLRNFGLRIRHS